MHVGRIQLIPGPRLDLQAQRFSMLILGGLPPRHASGVGRGVQSRSEIHIKRKDSLAALAQAPRSPDRRTSELEARKIASLNPKDEDAQVGDLLV